MRMRILTYGVAACLAAAAGISRGAERATVKGSVADAAGKPVEHATVMVYQAGVKKGYSIYCPTCYSDCGKHAVTDALGNFAIGGLSPDLLFTLLVVREGYAAAYLSKVDPAKGPAEKAILKPRPPIQDTSQLVRGRVVDGHGRPLRDAVVEQNGIKRRFDNGQMGMAFGPVDWIDQMAVTNPSGEFEIAYGKPAAEMILEVSARGMAPKLFTIPTGADRQTMTVTDGATVRGRLVLDGKPVANAEVGLTTHAHRSGTTFSEVRIGTQQDGTFAITNVPAGRIWILYPKMESLAARSIGAGVVYCETKADEQEVDLGDIQLRPAYMLRGKAILGGGRAIPPDMQVTLSADQSSDSQFAAIGADGTFEFRGLPPGVYEITPAVKGYQYPDRVAEVLVQRDVTGFTIRMEPATDRR